MTVAAIEWSFNPWRDRPRTAFLAAGVGLLACVAVASLGEGTVLTTALCFAVLAALSPALSPARCRVDEEGVVRRGPFGGARRAWRELHRGVVRPEGVLLSPYPRPHWLDTYRGLFLPLPVRDRDAVRAEIERRLASHGL